MKLLDIKAQFIILEAITYFISWLEKTVNNNQGASTSVSSNNVVFSLFLHIGNVRIYAKYT